MSDAAPAAAAEAPPKKSKKKLILMLSAALVLAGGGGGAFFVMKQKAAAAAAAAAAEEDDDEAPPAKVAHKDAAAKPTYVPLEAFVVNLSDKDTDRFAQIGITLQVDDSKVADDMKTYMPTLRNGILMILAHKSSEELLRRDGKETLAQEIMLAAAHALGIEVDEPQTEVSHGKRAKAKAEAADDEDEEEQPKKSKPKKKKKKKTVHNPVTHVHFSNFIIQ